MHARARSHRVIALIGAVAFVLIYATAVVMLTLASSEPMQISAWSEGAKP